MDFAIIRALVVAIAAFVSTACEEGEIAHDNHGYGYGYTEITYNNVRVRYIEGAEHIEIDQIGDAYKNVLDCTGLTATTAPLVVFVPYEVNSESDYLVQGRIYLDTGLIVVMSVADYSEQWTLDVLKHEFVHFILWDNGLSDAENMGHISSLFGRCSY